MRVCWETDSPFMDSFSFVCKWGGNLITAKQRTKSVVCRESSKKNCLCLVLCKAITLCARTIPHKHTSSGKTAICNAPIRIYINAGCQAETRTQPRLPTKSEDSSSSEAPCSSLPASSPFSLPLIRNPSCGTGQTHKKQATHVTFRWLPAARTAKGGERGKKGRNHNPGQSHNSNNNNNNNDETCTWLASVVIRRIRGIRRPKVAQASAATQGPRVLPRSRPKSSPFRRVWSCRIRVLALVGTN